MNKNKVLSVKHPSQCSSENDNFKKSSKTRELESKVKRMKRKTWDKSEKRENEWADSNTGVRIDNNDIVRLSILSDHIRILGDIPYDFDAETDVDG